MARGAMEVLSGVLTVKQPAVLKHKAFERHWCSLFYGVKTLAPRIDIYERDPHAGNVQCKKTIYIESAGWKKIDTLEPAFSFEVKNNKQYTFYCNSTAERREWLLSLCCISEGLFDTKHVVGVNNEGVISASSIAGDDYSVTIENDAYGGVSEVRTFFVLADQTDGCLSYRLQGIYKLSVGLGYVKLSDSSTDTCVIQWQITDLRNFGTSTQTMFVHAGKRSTTGEGKFTFRTTEASKIVGLISRETHIIQENRNGSNGSNTTLGNMPPKVPPLGNNNQYQNHPVAPLMKPKEDGDNYVNMATNGASSAASKHEAFLKELENKTGPGGNDNRKLSVQRAVSNSSNASDASNANLDKKTLKKMKDEQKRKEKEEKKRQEEMKKEERKQQREERQRLEAEKKRLEAEKRQMQKEERKSSRKDRKPNASSSQAESKPPEDENVYAVAYETTASLQQIHNTHQGVNKSEIYDEPWGQNSALGLLSPPAPEDDIEGIYASPEKRNTTRPTAPLPDDSNYQDTDSLAPGGPPPPIIPPTCKEEELSGDTGGNLYARTNQIPRATQNDYGHVYGIGSASQQFVSGRSVETDNNASNVYESM